MKNITTNSEYMNPKTGEIVTMTAVAKPRSRSPFSSFAMISLESIARLGHEFCQREIKPNDIKVLFCMLEHMKGDNEVDIYASAIQRQTGMTQRNVYGAIKNLLFNGAILKHKLIGSTQTYKISAHLAYRGTNHAGEIHAQAEIKRNERASLKVVK